MVVNGQVLRGGGEPPAAPPIPPTRVFWAVGGGLRWFGVRGVCAGDGVLNLVWLAAVDIDVTAFRMFVATSSAQNGEARTIWCGYKPYRLESDAIKLTTT